MAELSTFKQPPSIVRHYSLVDNGLGCQTKMNLGSIILQRETMGGTLCRPSVLSSQLSAKAWNQDRMHNLILCVGPGTPASILHAANIRNQEPSRSEINRGEDYPNRSDSDGDDEDQFTWTRMARYDDADNDEGANEDGRDEEEDYDNQQDEDIAESEEPFVSTDCFEAQTEDEASDDGGDGGRQQGDEDVAGQSTQPQREFERQQNRRGPPPNWKSEIRHGGCINTACWMDVPWRLSLCEAAASNNSNGDVVSIFCDDEAGHRTNSSLSLSRNYCPTQLATSGDDRVVKLWDARYAMGTASPLVGGWDTFSPLSTMKRPIGYQSEWKSHHKKVKDECGAIAGSILPLASLTTGHRGNVFHVTPLVHSPGKLLTCAADGYLRLIDISAETSSVVLHPFIHAGNSDLNSLLALGGGLAFSHVMLSANSGLLCSERGLHLFDLRLSPREQAQRSLLARSSSHSRPDNMNDDAESVGSNSVSLADGCKACAIWRQSASETESHYVFTGGSGSSVDLYDLRVDGSRRQVVERYRPRNIEHHDNVSVSGLDVSQDGKEVLVSYESDQIYAFPIMSKRGDGESEDCRNQALWSLDEINAIARKSGDRPPTAEAMGYGGHLNRFTFLKNARYAGPNDEYICTGSDSGHAYVMERGTGTVVSLMSADGSTCNGVIPHPSLPFFITYGIDSTARMWRATTPVDPCVCDSPTSRAYCSRSEKYEMSPVTQSPKMVQMLSARFKYEPGILPDFIATRQEISASGKFSAPNRRGMVDKDSPRIGNAYRSLPFILRSNRYECYRTAHQGMGAPVETDLDCFTVRVSICRLRFQATRLGLSFNLHQPWNFRNVRDEIHPADLVPDNPSDWILLDEQMTPRPILIDFYHMNWKEWKEYLILRDRRMAEYDRASSTHEDPPVWLQVSSEQVGKAKENFTWPIRSSLSAERDTESKYFSSEEKVRSQRYLYETAFVLKEGGNVAMKDGCLDTAARRYDKAIQYCSIAFVKFYEGQDKLYHLKDGLCALKTDTGNGGGRRIDSIPAVWSPLLRVLVTSRLNLSLLLLKPRFASVSDSITQALEALRLLGPFTVRLGAVVISTDADEADGDEADKKSSFIFEDEPEETFREARALQAKAFFRLGSAEMEKGDWAAAVEAFQACINSTDDKPDSLVTRRLQEAKTKRNSKKKRDRMKFEFALSDET